MSNAAIARRSKPGMSNALVAVDQVGDSPGVCEELRDLAVACLPEAGPGEALALGQEVGLPPWLALRLAGDGPANGSGRNGGTGAGARAGLRGRSWRPDEVHYLRERAGLEEAAEIARALKRTEVAIRVKAKRLGLFLRRRRRAHEIYTARDVGQRLGVDAKVVARWVEEGWLSATRSSDAPNTPHRIARSDVHRFLNSPPAAYAVAPDKIRDARFRRTWQRARHPLYLAVGEAAEKLGVPVATLSRLARLGRVPAVRWGNWLIREDHLDDVRKALHASSRKKPQSLRRLTVAERRLLVAGTALGFNSREMGERMGRAMGSLTGVLTQMAASGELAAMAAEMPFLWRLRAGRAPALLGDPYGFPELRSVAETLAAYRAGEDLSPTHWLELCAMLRGWLGFWIEEALPSGGQGTELENDLWLVAHRLRYRIPRESDVETDVTRAMALLAEIGLDPIGGRWAAAWEPVRKGAAPVRLGELRPPSLDKAGEMCSFATAFAQTERHHWAPDAP